jgi:hypothetical protein
MNAVAQFPSANSFDDSGIPLSGAQGDLLLVSIAVEPRNLETLLDRLGESRYPIDPRIDHAAQIEGRLATLVEFPAYQSWLDEIGKLLEGREAVTIRRCFAQRAAG